MGGEGKGGSQVEQWEGREREGHRLRGDEIGDVATSKGK